MLVFVLAVHRLHFNSIFGLNVERFSIANFFYFPFHTVIIIVIIVNCEYCTGERCSINSMISVWTACELLLLCLSECDTKFEWFLVSNAIKYGTLTIDHWNVSRKILIYIKTIWAFWYPEHQQHPNHLFTYYIIIKLLNFTPFHVFLNVESMPPKLFHSFIVPSFCISNFG